MLFELLDTARSGAALDHFWTLKGRVYEEVIYSALGVRADFVCREYIIRHPELFCKEDALLTDREFRNRHPGLFVLLAAARQHDAEADP